MVRDAFDLAKEKCVEQGQGGAIIFIDELDAIGTKRFGGEQSGDREVQRTMLELLNQLDGFTVQDNIKVSGDFDCMPTPVLVQPPSSDENRSHTPSQPCGPRLSDPMPPALAALQVIAATNRPDVLDPALLRSGRLDRKIELPHPTEEARARIMEIHSRKMNIDKVAHPTITAQAWWHPACRGLDVR